MARALTIGLLALVLGGCSGSQRIVPVSGVVTLDGEPLADAVIGFEPIATEGEFEAGMGSYARSDAEGRFVLRALTKEEGALVGVHRVSVSTVVGKEGPNGEMLGLTKERVPARYNNDTKLTFEVPAGGTDQANLDLKSK
ncbi:hypothetical protein GC197_11835 [bacterium]|nr:hypothetical protein [bacterium]